MSPLIDPTNFRVQAHPSCPDCRCEADPHCEFCGGWGLVIPSDLADRPPDDDRPLLNPCPNACPVRHFY